MNVLLVNGSPNQHGCTYEALSHTAKSLNENGIDTEIVWIGNKPLGGCIDCRMCATRKQCVFDDVVNEVRPKAYAADGFIFGTPVHYAAASGNMTSFMDRLFFSENVGNANAAFRLKPGAVVVSARRAGTTAAFDQMIKYITISEMPMVSSRYWPMIHGAKPEEIAQDEEGMSTLWDLGRNMAYLLKCLDAGKSAGVEAPERVKKPFTNFIR